MSTIERPNVAEPRIAAGNSRKQQHRRWDILKTRIYSILRVILHFVQMDPLYAWWQSRVKLGIATGGGPNHFVVLLTRTNPHTGYNQGRAIGPPAPIVVHPPFAVAFV